MREAIWGISWRRRSLWQINTPKSSQRFQLFFDVVLLASRRSWCRIGARIFEDNRWNLLLPDQLIEVGEVRLNQFVPFRNLLIAALLEQVEDVIGLLRWSRIG